MFIVLNYSLDFDDSKAGTKYSFNTGNFYKRNYTESLPGLLSGGCITKNFCFGDSLYF